MADLTEFLDWLMHPNGPDTRAVTLVNLISINDENYTERLGYYISWCTLKTSLEVGTPYAFEAVSLTCPFCSEPYTNDVVLSTIDTFLLGLAYRCGTQIEFRQHYDAVHPKLTPIKIRRSAQCRVVQESEKSEEEDVI